MVDVDALVDSGSDVNVLPFDLGQRLGLKWSSVVTLPSLGGSLSAVPARGVAIQAIVGPFSPVTLTFAWVQTPQVPIILGQVNFFLEYDICFHRSRLEFTIQPRTP
jgi:hypothetical protein